MATSSLNSNGLFLRTPQRTSESPQSTKLRSKGASEQAIIFDNSLIFGKGFSKVSKKESNIVSQLISDGVLNFNGTIDMSQIGKIHKKSLWLYIRYIWQFNHTTHDVYRRMSKDSEVHIDTPLAHNFVKEVLANMSLYRQNIDPSVEEAIAVTSTDLASFINATIQSQQVIVPMISNLLDLMMQRLKEDADLHVGVRDGLQTHVNMRIPVTLSLKENSEETADGYQNNNGNTPKSYERVDTHLVNSINGAKALHVEVRIGGACAIKQHQSASDTIRRSMLRCKK